MNTYYTECKNCKGLGYLEEDGFGTKLHNELECSECSGYGYFFTEEGEELFNFLQKLKEPKIKFKLSEF